MPYYADSWSGRLAPQADTDGLVFNYTYTLPQFLRSIYFLLTTIAALEPNSLHLYANVLTRCLTRLQSVHQTIVSSGIIAARIPSMDEVGVIDGDFIPPFTTNWILNDGTPNPTYFPYGAVDRYSGANNMGSYIGDHFPYWGADLTTWWAPTAENFLTLLSFWTVGKMKSLYVELGMPAVWQAINQLLQLTGQPLQSTPPYSAWSFAEVTSLLGLRLPPPRRWPPVVPVWFQEPPGLEAAVKAFLLATPPYESFRVFGSDPSDPTYDPGSLTVAIPPIPLPSGSLFTFLTGVSLAPVAEFVASTV
jgi:hypothetical protein